MLEIVPHARYAIRNRRHRDVMERDDASRFYEWRVEGVIGHDGCVTVVAVYEQ